MLENSAPWTNTIKWDLGMSINCPQLCGPLGPPMLSRVSLGCVVRFHRSAPNYGNIPTVSEAQLSRPQGNKIVVYLEFWPCTALMVHSFRSVKPSSFLRKQFCICKMQHSLWHTQFVWDVVISRTVASMVVRFALLGVPFVSLWQPILPPVFGSEKSVSPT